MLSHGNVVAWHSTRGGVAQHAGRLVAVAPPLHRQDDGGEQPSLGDNYFAQDDQQDDGPGPFDDGGGGYLGADDGLDDGAIDDGVGYPGTDGSGAGVGAPAQEDSGLGGVLARLNKLKQNLAKVSRAVGFAPVLSVQLT